MRDMREETTAGLLLLLLLMLAASVRPAKAQETIYIKTDGSVFPATVPISSIDNITYTLYGDLYDPIVVERDNIILDGGGHTLLGTGSGTGINLTRRSNVIVKNMEIKMFNEGLRLEHSLNNTICGNTMTANNWYAVFAIWSLNNTILENNITANWDGIWLKGSSRYNVVTRNNVTLNKYNGIGVSGSSNNEISSNNIADNGYGIWIKAYSSNNVISGNNITGSEIRGLRLYLSFDNTLRNNSIVGSKYNFHVWGEDLAHFVNDVDISNTVDGRPIYYWINEHDRAVPLDAGYVALVDCTRISVEDLNLKENGQGVLLANTTDSTIVNDNITKNEYGVLLFSSSSNLIYHDNFVENPAQVCDVNSTEPSVNVWDNGYPPGGNYWRDYVGSDFYSGLYQNETGSDGIGDMPYVVKGNSQDSYPLLAPIDIFDVGCWNGTARHIDVVSNSTVSDFQLDIVQRIVSFNVTGQIGVGFCRVTIPNIIIQDLWAYDYTVLLNGDQWSFRESSDATDRYIYVEFADSGHEVIIVPEFPTTIVLTSLMTTIALTLVFTGKFGKPLQKKT
jgi:parallel beta-helix repeat protein